MSDHAELRSVLTTKYPAERAVVKKSDLAALLADYDRILDQCIGLILDSFGQYEWVITVVGFDGATYPTREAAIAALLKGSE